MLQLVGLDMSWKFQIFFLLLYIQDCVCYMAGSFSICTLQRGELLFSISLRATISISLHLPLLSVAEIDLFYSSIAIKIKSY